MSQSVKGGAVNISLFYLFASTSTRVTGAIQGQYRGIAGTLQGHLMGNAGTLQGHCRFRAQQSNGVRSEWYLTWPPILSIRSGAPIARDSSGKVMTTMFTIPLQLLSPDHSIISIIVIILKFILTSSHCCY